VRIRPLVGQEVEDGHQSVEYGVKRLKSNRFKLSIKAPQTAEDKADECENDSYASNSPKVSKRIPKRFQRMRKRQQQPDMFKGFKRVLLPTDDNAATYSACVAPLVDDMLRGSAVCAFAYGHTGSGKTHTIFGYGEQEGMYHLFARDLCQRVKAYNAQRAADAPEAMIEVRFLELYQQRMRDLLSAERTECFLREGSKGDVQLRGQTETQSEHKIDGRARVVVRDITRAHVSELADIHECIAEGMQSRNVGRSTLHDKSSRSHAFLEFEIVSQPLIDARKAIPEVDADVVQLESAGHMVRAKPHIAKLKALEKAVKGMLAAQDPIGGSFVFVDLAGNEYGRDVGGDADKQQEKERNEINKSLFALKECIRGLNKREKRVPYRASKLTMYLRRYLSGERSRGVMITNIGPSAQRVRQTLNSLKYCELVAKAAK